MAETIRVSGMVPAPPERIFAAWLDSEGHSSFTGGKATVEGTIGGTFTAWDGYIQGTTLDAEPPRRIIQSWRSTDFPPDAPPSRLEVILEGTAGGTRITFVHSDIPDGQGSGYEQGWKDHYLEPMRRHFGPPPAPEAQVAKPAKRATTKKRSKPALKAAAVKAKGKAKSKSKAKVAPKRAAKPSKSSKSSRSKKSRR